MQTHDVNSPDCNKFASAPGAIRGSHRDSLFPHLLIPPHPHPHLAGTPQNFNLTTLLCRDSAGGDWACRGAPLFFTARELWCLEQSTVTQAVRFTLFAITLKCTSCWKDPECARSGPRLCAQSELVHNVPRSSENLTHSLTVPAGTSELRLLLPFGMATKLSAITCG